MAWNLTEHNYGLNCRARLELWNLRLAANQRPSLSLWKINGMTECIDSVSAYPFLCPPKTHFLTGYKDITCSTPLGVPQFPSHQHGAASDIQNEARDPC